MTLPHDQELFTRHEVQAAPPDVLVTNYSMLEYMLMRPLERPIFDHTRGWLSANPKESFLLVIDEAHLYRAPRVPKSHCLLGGCGNGLGLKLIGFRSFALRQVFTTMNMPRFSARNSRVNRPTIFAP